MQHDYYVMMMAAEAGRPPQLSVSHRCPRHLVMRGLAATAAAAANTKTQAYKSRRWMPDHVVNQRSFLANVGQGGKFPRLFLAPSKNHYSHYYTRVLLGHVQIHALGWGGRRCQHDGL